VRGRSRARSGEGRTIQQLLDVRFGWNTPYARSRFLAGRARRRKAETLVVLHYICTIWSARRQLQFYLRSTSLVMNIPMTKPPMCAHQATPPEGTAPSDVT